MNEFFICYIYFFIQWRARTSAGRANNKKKNGSQLQLFDDDGDDAQAINYLTRCSQAHDHHIPSTKFC